MRLLENEATANKKILLIDRDEKEKNDRTWCYWEAGAGFFEPVVTKKWDTLLFYSNQYSSTLDIAPYSYKMIRGVDFYHYCKHKIQQHPHVTFLQDEVLAFSGEMIQLTSAVIDCRSAVVFSSLYKPAAKQRGRHYLLQHFKGWVVETPQPVFDTEKATLMDFRVSQQYGAAFVYVMPLTANKALVEYTLFSDALLSQQQYEQGLNDYLQQWLNIGTYTVSETEFGVIPMTSAAMPPVQDGIYLLGTAGGQTKASTGYTFQFIQKQAASIVANMAAGKAPLGGKPHIARRFRLYDNTLLHILAHNKMPGDEIFARLFHRNSASAIFKFLDNETNFAEELQLMQTVPRGLFTKAAIAEIIKNMGR
jgi:lycopene beta-cyclase